MASLKRLFDGLNIGLVCFLSDYMRVQDYHWIVV